MKLDVLLAELKRRKILRVAAVYGATSFVVLQIADIVFPSVGLPQWTITLVVALTVVGFPLAMGVTWIFEATPDGLRRTEPAQEDEIEAILAQPRSRRWPAGIAALLGIVLLAGGVAWTVGQRGGGRATNYDSIAVLPFVNMSGDADNEYFGDGLAEELLNALSSIEGLKVAARTSAFAFKGTNMDVRVIGDTLGVGTVLEGGVRRSAERIRITAQLIDARTGYHLWSGTYDRPLTDLFSVQDAIAREIVNALAGKFTTSKGGLYRGGTSDVQAYDLYLLGRQKWATRQVPELREAVQHFEQAISRDSSFALAWSGFADAIDALMWRSEDGLERLAEAKYAAQRALVLDRDLSEGWASLGILALDFDRDFRMAELALRQAIALKPSYASAHHWLSDALRYSGRTEESLQASSAAVELDPVYGLGLSGQLQTLLNLGRWQEARATADRLLRVNWSETGNLINMLSAAPQLGFRADELEHFAKSWATTRGYSKANEASVIGRAMIEPAVRPRAREVLAMMAAEKINPLQLAELSIAIGDLEGAMKLLQHTAAERNPSIIIIGTDWVFDLLRQDPRFIRIVEELGLPNGR